MESSGSGYTREVAQTLHSGYAMMYGGDIHLIILFLQYQPQTDGFLLENNRDSPISPCVTSQIGKISLENVKITV